MKITDNYDKYKEGIKDLLVELQEYIAEIDKEKYNILTNEYREMYFEKTLNQVNKYDGKNFLAVDDEKAIGIIVGVINNEEESTYDFKVPKRGRITELIISKKYRSKGIGEQLLNHM